MERETTIIRCDCILLFFCSAPWIIFGTSFQSSKYTGDIDLLKLFNDFCTYNNAIPKIP
jgi:hypothetical protein